MPSVVVRDFWDRVHRKLKLWLISVADPFSQMNGTPLMSAFGELGIKIAQSEFARRILQ